MARLAEDGGEAFNGFKSGLLDNVFLYSSLICGVARLAEDGGGAFNGFKSGLFDSVF